MFIEELICKAYAEYLDFPGYRLGQAFFNLLPGEVQNVVAGSLFDPFHKRNWNSTAYLDQWVDEHLILEDGEIIAVFNNNQLLWERP